MALGLPSAKSNVLLEKRQAQFSFHRVFLLGLQGIEVDLEDMLGQELGKEEREEETGSEELPDK